MTRNGKIARLPRTIREELNRRLDNGEYGVRLVAWLNGLRKVKKVLKADFEGREINEQNLTEWKGGGYLDWLAQQQILTTAQEFKADGKELAAVSGDLTECLATTVAARYAAMLHGWNGEMTDEIRGKLRALRGLSREVVRLRRNDRDFERIKIERESLELKRQKAEQEMKQKAENAAKSGDDRERTKREMTKSEMDEALQRVILGKEKEEVK